MTVKITPNDKGNPPGKVAEAELHFTDGPLDGLKLIGFAIWEQRGGVGGYNVTFPARQYTVNGDRRTFALLGDLAFLHDVSGLVNFSDLPCTLVVMDNGGGGIFSFLPQASAVETERFELLFGTPPTSDVGDVARGFGLSVCDVATVPELEAALNRAAPALIRVAAFRPYTMVRNGQYWQLLSSGFVHANFSHLFFNLLTFYFFAFTLERRIGTLAFVALYGLGLLLGNLSTYFKHRNEPDYVM